MRQRGVKEAMQRHKLLGLEAVRFLSALAILFWHYQHFFYVNGKPVSFVREQQPLYLIFQYFYAYGAERRIPQRHKSVMEYLRF